MRETGRRKLLGFVVCTLVALLGANPALADIDNTATVSGTYNAALTTSPPSSASVPVTSSAPGMIVTKTANDTTDVVAGQMITYTYTVLNSGNTMIANVALSESHNGLGTAPVPDNETLTGDTGTTGDSTDTTASDGVWSQLAPGDTITFTSTYTVTQNDVNNRQ